MNPVRYHGIDKHVGNTPLIRLRRLSELTGCEILGKAEFMNPGGSVKDRAALGMILDAEAKGRLRTGDTIVEGTAGNTGIGLTLLGHARGLRSVIVIPETQSPEKIGLLRTLGAEVRTVPEKPITDPGNYNRVAQRLAEENGWFWANQFDNTANRQAHYKTTGPEIWEQTSGQVTAFVAAVGTGGTLAGTALYLKERNPNTMVVCADPYGAAMWSWFTQGNTDIKDGDSSAEGIGQCRVTKNLEGIVVDKAYRIPDQDALTVVYQLLREEGLFLGLSSGINIAGALRLARERGPGQTIVTILCDSGAKYQSKMFNPSWLAAHRLDPDQPIQTVL
ncbi:MAG TPA: cysteine synthase A [Candidatus Limnocylindria bacterium]|jgi:cysteine synthase A|nr:cysteine synthase A [Candidatus Limnocylindria bacterium]